MKWLTCCMVLATSMAATPCRADGPLAGAPGIVTSSHGQAFCTDKGQLQALIRAHIAQAPVGIAAFPGCTYVGDGAPVTVTEDLSPHTRLMHIVRAHADVPFGSVDGYTYSVGLYRY